MLTSTLSVDSILPNKTPILKEHRYPTVLTCLAPFLLTYKRIWPTTKGHLPQEQELFTMPLNPSRRPGNNRNTEQMRRWHNLLGREMAVMLDLRCFKEEAWVRSKRNPASAWNSHILKLTNTLACSHNQKWLNRWQQKTLRMKTSKA